MNKIKDTFDQIIARTDARSSGDAGQYSGKCPSHDDNSPSLSLKLTEERILIKCHVGCSIKEVCSGLEIEESELFRESGAERKTFDTSCGKKNPTLINADGKVQFYSSKHKKQVTENVRYTYHKADGSAAFFVIRAEPKDFRPMRTDGQLNLNGVERVPYRLPELLEGIKDSELILLLEGEKDAERAAEMGFVATTFVGGAGKWRDDYLEHFIGAEVVLVPDNDLPGLKGMTNSWNCKKHKNP